MRLIDQIWSALLIIYGERFAPISLSREDGIAEAIIHLNFTETLLLDILFGASDSLLHLEAIEVKVVTLGIDHTALLGVEALFGDIRPLDERYNREVEMASECIVARVMSRHSHDGSGAISGEDIVADPNRYLLAGKRIDGITTSENTGDLLFDLAFTLSLMFHLLEIGIDLLLMFGGGKESDILGFGSEHHESNTEYGIGARGEDIEHDIGVSDHKLHLGALRTADPITLSLLERIAPLEGVEVIEQTGSVSRDAEAPLIHHLLLHGETATHAQTLAHLIIGEDSSEFGAPIHHRFALISDTIIHQSLALLSFREVIPLPGGERESLAAGSIHAHRARLGEMLHETLDGHSLIKVEIIIRIEHLHERPLSPAIIVGVAGAYLTAPIERKTDLIELLAITIDIFDSSLLGVLTGLDGILLGGEAVSVITHRVKHVKTLLALKASIDIAGYIAEGMTDMQPGTRRIGEHIEDIELRTRGILMYLIDMILAPELLPALFDFLVVVFHLNIKNQKYNLI